MNGFTNAILTLLLGWLRTLLNAVWSLFSSDGGGELLALLREHWKLIFLVLCLGGFVVDRLIYLFRWRPYYVWASRRRARKRPAETDQEPAPYGDAYQHAYAPQSHYDPFEEDNTPVITGGQTARYEPIPARMAPQGANGFAPAYPSASADANPDRYMQEPIPYSQPARSSANRFAPPAPAPYRTSGGETASGYVLPTRTSFAPAVSGGTGSGTSQANPVRFAPSAAAANPPRQPACAQNREEYRSERRTPPVNAGLGNPSAPRRYPAAPGLPQDMSFAPTSSYAPLAANIPVTPEPMADEPRYDDDPMDWPMPLSMAKPSAPQTREISPRRADRYLEDVRSGFAPQPTPEQLYAPRALPERRDPYLPGVTQPVHPGLDLETFQQNIGLTGAPMSYADLPEKPGAAYPDFVPFPDAERTDATPSKPKGLGALAKKARSFVSGDDERNPLTIRDLQPTVDVKNAFHSPVYPKKKSEGEEE